MSRADPARVLDYLGHILQAIASIDEYTAGMNEAAYVGDKKTQDAVVRNFEVVGEACNNIAKHHPLFAKEHSDVPWSVAYEMRNSLSHGYFMVDHGIVWRTIHVDLPALRQMIEKLVTSLTPASTPPPHTKQTPPSRS
jgi:uncharacterized protein with HEPN domain